MTHQYAEALPAAVLITRNLPPLLGGMERLNLHLATELARFYKLTVIGPVGCGKFLPETVVVIEVPPKPLFKFLWTSLIAAWNIAAIRPALAVAGSGLTAPMANLVARRGGAVAAAYVHGLDLVAKHPLYRLLWLPALRNLDLALANSRNTAEIATKSGVAGCNVIVLNPGVEKADATPASGAAFRARHALVDSKILLSVGRMTPRKGLKEFVQNSLGDICSRHHDAVLVVVGNEAPDALRGRSDGMSAEVADIAAALGLKDHIRLLGVLGDAELGAAYTAADVHIFPVREVTGDIEGFGMVAIEAAAHGLPTVAFAVGGVPDAVETDSNGYLISPGNYSGFSAAVCRLLEENRAPSLTRSTQRFSERFHWDRFGAKLLVALKRSGIPVGDVEALP